MAALRGCKIIDVDLVSAKTMCRLERMFKDELATGLPVNDCGSLYSGTVYATWREKVALWCYDVVDHLREARSVVHVAMNVLDRYSVTLAQYTPLDEKLYEVVSMAALFLAVRIAGSGNLQLPQLVSLSQGGVSVKDLMAAGTKIIHALNWDHRIITPLDFIPVFISMVPTSDDTSERQRILEAASYLAEIAACDVVLSIRKPSEVALAAVLNALLVPSSHKMLGALSEVARRAIGVSINMSTIDDVRARLESIYRQSADSSDGAGLHVIPDEPEDQRSAQCVQHHAVSQSDSSATLHVSVDGVDVIPEEDSSPVGIKRSVHGGDFELESPLRKKFKVGTL